MVTNSAIKAGSVRSPAPGLDIFKTPENPAFYSANLYQSLDKSKQEIRLIELSTQTGDDDMLECKLLPATLLTDARNQYLAMSYCAGDPADTNEIMVNGVRCNVFANLHYALVLARHYWMRSSGQGPLRIWIDQLCINQHDLKERSHQVGFMRNIYQFAERTLACLSTSQTSGEGLKWFNDLCDAVALQEDDGPLRYDRKDALGTAEWDYESEEIPRESTRQSDTEDDRFESLRCQWVFIRDYLWHNIHNEAFVNGWIAFYDILSSPWWNRAWVCQEFLVSRQVTFMFSKYFVSWEQHWSVMGAFCAIHNYDLINRKQFLESQYCLEGSVQDLQLCRILDIVNQRDLFPQVNHVGVALRMKINCTGSMDLKDLLLHSRSCKSSDDRDRVYAMLGLASPGYDIVPDYSEDLSAGEVMILTTRAIIEKEDSLEILFRATRFVQSGNLDVPSWVVDWSSTEASGVQFGRNMHVYRPSSTPHESPERAFEVITNTKDKTRTHILWVYGTFITKIRLVGAVWPIAAFSSAQGWHGKSLNSIADGDEVWFLQGLREAIVLRSYLDGHQVISPALVMKGSSVYTEEGRAKRSRIKLY
ncbi:hypothetical protein FMEXI_10210 [Fusarium mexicanum]|uniref:Heterokaryon incompatibility domain-containing protein n=1 Tax=Fusarium mexicanum TaxID=751941 RepID=A0A8H5IL69_9HYPO|nr:hypothetical protein FMEXI_10210 [Fusarium mexicanum]